MGQAAQQPTLEEIDAELARREQLRRRAAMENGGRLSIADIDAELARRRQQQQPQAPPQRTAMNDVSGGVAAASQGTFLGFGDEISGGIAGVIDAGGELLDQTANQGASPGFDWNEIGGAYQRGYQRQTQFQRGALQDFRQERPRAAAFTEGVGGTVPLILTAGASAPEQLTARGGQAVAPGLAMRMGQGASVGALYGGAYGVGTADGLPLQDRLNAGLDEAAVGGAIGGVAPVAIQGVQTGWNALRPAWQQFERGAQRAAESIPTPPPNTVGSLGGNLAAGGGRRRGALTPPPPPPAPEPIPEAAVNVVDRLARRSRQTPDALEGQFAQARANPQGQVVADVFGDPGVRTTRAIVQAPGETGEVAAQVADTRFQEAPSRIIGALRRSLGVSESRSAAMERLAADYEAASANLYQPLWERPVTPEQTALFEQRVAPLLEDPVMQRAMRRGEQIFERERRLGHMQGDVQENLPRYLHLMKMGLDDEIAAGRRDPTGIQATEMRGVMELRRRFIDAVDEIVPGYRDARARWGGLREAEDALEEGAGFLRMNADEVGARMQQMSPFQREHARIGLADELSQRVGLAGNTVGHVNVANIQAFRSPEMQRRIAAAFDSPQQAADFLDTVTSQNRLMRNASQWGGGSSTYSNILHGEDAGAAFAEAAGEAARGEPGRAVMRLARQAGNALSDNAIERGNNEAGRVLMRRIDSQEAKAFTDQVIAILRQREQQRATQGVAARVAGGAAGEMTGRSDEQN